MLLITTHTFCPCWASVGRYLSSRIGYRRDAGCFGRGNDHGLPVGAEGAIRVGMTLGRAHYNHGFHQTATACAFGATLAAGRLLGLDSSAASCAWPMWTRASGLTSQFGSMGKPYNAGISAANGVECATLAGLGFTSADDGLMGHQGFVGAHLPGGVRSDRTRSGPGQL